MNFTETDIKNIEECLLVTLEKKTRVTFSEAYQEFKNKYPNEIHFKNQLSKAFKEGTIKKLATCKGPYGGIVLLENKPKAKVKFQPTISPKELSLKEDNKGSSSTIKYETIEKPLEFTQESKSLLKTNEKPIIYSLFIGKKHYKVPQSINIINDLLERVIECKQNVVGTVVFNEKVYACDEVQEGYLDRFLFYYFGASVEI